jgi:D-serine deaminase-like pyridoxal phosphate-dependent protein
MRVSDIDTPAVLIDLDRVEANLARRRPMPRRTGCGCGRM